MKASNGNHQINFECSGNRNGTVIAMAHSLGCNLHMWDPQMSVLEPDYKIIRLDMRGHGQSDTPPGPYTLDGLAEDVIAVLDSQNVERAHWVGLSVGGMIGQCLLLRHAERFFSATLADTASFQPPAAGPMWNARIKTVDTHGLGSIVDETMERWFTPAGLKLGGPGIDAIKAQLESTSAQPSMPPCELPLQSHWQRLLFRRCLHLPPSPE